MRSNLGWALATAMFATVALPPSAAAQDSPWLFRVRAARLVPADKSDAIPALGVPADAIEVSKKTIPDIDISYFFTPNLAAELLLTVPQKHDVTVRGVGKIGTFKHLPPTLLAQYHFQLTPQFDPYVGAGLNYTRISSVNLNVPGVGALDLDNSSFGAALQAGFDYKIDRHWVVNFDVKYIRIASDVKVAATGATVSEVRVDPLLWGVGVGYRF